MAFQAVHDKAKVQASQKALIIGAAGVDETFAVRITKAFRVNFTGTWSASNVQLVKDLGEERIIDYASK